MLRIVLLTLTAFCGFSAAAMQRTTPIEAVAYITGPIAENGAQVKGNVTFTQNACGENVYVRVYITGLTPGSHGFHIHEKGDLTNGCTSMAGHYNPDKVDHGAPEHEVRHVGDLGNILADDSGIVDTTITDRVISLAGKWSILARGVVVHELADDLGLTNHPDSKKTGNAGGRVACGVIGVKSDLEQFPQCKDGASTMTLSLSLLAFVMAMLMSRSI